MPADALTAPRRRRAAPRHQAQEALRQREAHLQFLVGRIPGFIWTTDTALRLTLRMGRGLEAIDAQRPEVLGHHISHWLGTEDPHSPTIAAHLRALSGQAATCEQQWEGRLYSNHLEPLRAADGTIAGVIGIAFDISERQQAEQALQAAKAELEARVSERTAALVLANQQLQRQLAERAQVEAALRESELRFQNAFQHAPIGMALVNRDGRALHCNQALAEMLGYTRDELIDKTLAEMVPADDLTAAQEDRRRLLAGEVDSYQAERRYIHKSGRIVWTYTSASLVRDAEGRPLYTISHLHDITARKQAEQALRDSEERYALSVAGANDGLWDWNIEANEVYLSPRWKAILGNAVHELGADPLAWVSRLHPADAAPVRATLAAHLRGELPHFEVEYRIRHSDGTYRWVLSRGLAVRRADGRPYRMAGSLTDITERREVEEELRESEERFRKIFEEGPLGMALVGRDYRLVKVNATMCRMLGYSEEELLGLSFADITHPQDLETDLRLAQQVFAGEIPSYQIEKRYVTKPGGLIWVSLTASVITGETGQPLYGIGMVEEITARKRAEQASQRHQAELAHALRVSTLGEMAAGLAHELNQPLSAIVSYARGCVHRLRAGAAEPADLLYAVEQIAEQALRGGEILQRHRHFLRSGAPSHEWVNVNVVVENVGRLASSEARAEGVAIRLRLTPLLPPVQADGVQLEQVVLNLVRNAIDAMREGNPAELCIHTTLGAREIEVAVEDRGRGVPPELGERIFDAFVTTKPDGLGMGLSISRTIVEAHGGRLWATANPERGTTFRFVLPLP